MPTLYMNLSTLQLEVRSQNAHSAIIYSIPLEHCIAGALTLCALLVVDLHVLLLAALSLCTFLSLYTLYGVPIVRSC